MNSHCIAEKQVSDIVRVIGFYNCFALKGKQWILYCSYSFSLFPFLFSFINVALILSNVLLLHSMISI